MAPPSDWYGAHVEEVSARFESLSPDDVHGWLVDLLPPAPGALALDVGAGTGRDAAWLAGKGLDVVAVEPSGPMLETARLLHPTPDVRWVSDSLPALAKVCRLGLAFDLILLSGVWMFVAPADRARAFRKLIGLLKPGGRLALSLRIGPPDRERGMHPVDVAEIETLARSHGALVERIAHNPDLMGRPGLSWSNLVLRLPDDGTGALPLLRQVILNDSKSSTYKLALLRTLCRIADSAAGLGREDADGQVEVPFGLVGLYWLRLFKPLVAADLPQLPNNRGQQGLGFVGPGYRALADVSPLDLRLGAVFAGARAKALHDALAEACRTIEIMPAHYMTFTDGGAIFPVARARRVPPPAQIVVDGPYLRAFGLLRVPGHLWRAMQRLAVWIEPALSAEWKRLMIDYAERQDRRLAPEIIDRAMLWSEPAREVGLARSQAGRLLGTGALYCVWSGRSLAADTLDIDHCFPWSAWPCDDLWNLMPAHREVNQRQKRDRLPAAGLLRAAQDRIQAWWESGYLKTGEALAARFQIEARASLPVLGTDAGAAAATLDDVFDALALQQVRLRADQGLALWDTPG